MFFDGETAFLGNIIFPGTNEEVVRTRQTNEEHGPVDDFPFVLL